MGEWMRNLLELSLAGGALFCLVLLARRLAGNRLSGTACYVLLILVLLRLVIPFGPEDNLAGRIAGLWNPAAESLQAWREPGIFGTEGVGGGEPGGAGDRMDAEPASGDRAQGAQSATAGQEARNTSTGNIHGLAASGGGQSADAPEGIAPLDGWNAAILTVFGVWAAAASGILALKIHGYLKFVRTMRENSIPISGHALAGGVDRALAEAAVAVGIRRSVEVRLCRYAASPITAGLFHPAIYLPEGTLDRDLEYIFRHELTHVKRGDLWFKWLAELACAVHWFNPVVYGIRRELARCCELACDERATFGLEGEERLAYGRTLLTAAAQGRGRAGGRPAGVGISMCEEGENLRERLRCILEPGKRSAAAKLVSLALIAAVCVAGAFACGFAPGTESDRDQLIEELADSLAVDRGQGAFSFTVPEEAPSGWDWMITVYGSVTSEEGAAVPFSAFAAESGFRDWVPGKTYTWKTEFGRLDTVNLKASILDSETHAMPLRITVNDKGEKTYEDFSLIWEDAYREMLDDQPGKTAEFRYDVDGDGIPELFIEDGATDGAFLDVYVFRQEGVAYAGRLREHMFRLEGEPGIYNYDETEPGVFRSAYYELRDGMLLEAEGSVELSCDTGEGTYLINGRPVEKEEYDKAAAQYFQTSNAVYEARSIQSAENSVYAEIREIVRRIEDREAREAVYEYWNYGGMLYTVAETHLYSFEDVGETPEDLTDDEEQRALLVEWKARIERLSRLSGEDLKEELADLYREEIRRGLSNPDASFTGLEQSYGVYRYVPEYAKAAGERAE